jgi:Ca2+-binding EF-hand superfamily protein/CubicO group peptidase (beta-lactamase class C family)
MAAETHLSLRSIFASQPLYDPEPELEFDAIPEEDALLPGAISRGGNGGGGEDEDDEDDDMRSGHRYQPRWRPSERRLAVDAVDVMLDDAEEAMKSCQTSVDWEASIEQLDKVRLKAPEMRGMDGSEQRLARLNANLRRAEQERKRCEQQESSSLEAKMLLEKRKEQANKLMKDFERANQKGRFKGKLAKYAKKTAPTFVDLEDADRDKPGAPLFTIDDVIQVADLSNPESWQVEPEPEDDDYSDEEDEEDKDRRGDGADADDDEPKKVVIPETRWFIATVVDYKGEGHGGDSFRLEYRWRNGTYGALRVDPEQEVNERHMVRRRLLPHEAEERAKKKAERRAKEEAAREQLEAAGVPADDAAVERLLESLEAKDGGTKARTDGKPAGHIGDLYLGVRFIPSAEQTSLERMRQVVEKASLAVDNALDDDEMEQRSREWRMEKAKLADLEREMAEALRERTAIVGTLCVVVRRAALSVGSGTDCDPYVELTFDQQGEKTQHKTSVQRQTRKPIWQEGNIFKLDVYGSEGASKAVSWATMLIRVFDHDRLSDDDYLGGAKVDLVPYIQAARPEQAMLGDVDGEGGEGGGGLDVADDDLDDEDQQMDVTIDLYKLVGRVWLTMNFAEYEPPVVAELTEEEKQAEAEARELAMLQEQFAKVDVDESGTLDLTEISELAELVAEQQGTNAPNKQALEEAFRVMDVDGSGEVEFSEFRDFWLSQKKDAASQQDGGQGVGSSAIAAGLFSTMKRKKKEKKAAAALPMLHGKKVLGTLTVTVVKAVIDDTSQESDPYFELELLQDGERADRTFRTKVRKATSKPTWGDEESAFEYTILAGTKNLVVTMFDYDRFSADDFLGNITVKLTPFLDGGEHKEIEFLLKDDKEDGQQSQILEAFSNETDMAKSRWKKAGGKALTASILKTAAADFAARPEEEKAEKVEVIPPTEFERLVEKVRFKLYGEKPPEKPKGLIDIPEPEKEEEDEIEIDDEDKEEEYQEDKLEKALKCCKAFWTRAAYCVAVFCIALALLLKWCAKECAKTPSRYRRARHWVRERNPYLVRPVDNELLALAGEEEIDEDDWAEIPWLETIEQGHPDGTYFELSGATGLAKADFIGGADPYAVLYFNNERIGKTRVKFNTMAPVWNQRFGIPKPDPRSINTVRIEVYDYDRFSGDDFMGQVVLTGKGLSAFPTTYTDFPLEKTVLIEEEYTENPDLLAKEQDREFLTWERTEKKKRKEWESWNELVQGELSLRLFDASNVAKWQDPRNTFLSRYERDKLDNLLSAKYAACRPRPLHPAPQYSLELTDYEMIELANTLDVPWEGIKSYTEAQQAKATRGQDDGEDPPKRTRAEKKRMESLFLTRSQRRTLEQRVSKTWKRDLPHVQMPLWCVQFSDTAIVVLAKRMGIKWNGPRAQPNEKIRQMWAHMDRDASGELDKEELQLGMATSGMNSTDGAVAQLMRSADEDGDGKISKKEFLDHFEGPPPDALPKATLGPPSAEIFELFADPIVREYMDELPATGAVVTLVKDGKIFFNKGYGFSGTKGHSKAQRAREKEDKAREKEKEAKWRAEKEAAAHQAEDFLVSGAASLLDGLDLEDREALHDALHEFFNAMDTDGSGWVEALELKDGLSKAGMLNGEDAAMALLNRADDDGDGRVTLDEFLACFETEDSLGVSLEEKVSRNKKHSGANNPRMRKVRKLFGQVDADCEHGSVSAETLRAGCETVGLSLMDSAVRGMLEEIHSDGDAGWENQVSMDQFRGLIIKYFEGGTTENMTPEERARYKREMRKKKTIEAIFHAMDTDHSGTCDANELMAGMLKAGLATSKQEVLDILAEGDQDGDGDLTVHEFMRCFEGIELEQYTPEEAAAAAKREALTTLFLDMDKDGSGEVNGSELRVGLISAGICQTDEEVMAILKNGDKEGDGEMSLEEFIACFPDLQDEAWEDDVDDPVAKLTSLFYNIDDDQTGWVDSKELYEGLLGAGVVVTPEEIQELLAAGDDDGDGRLTLEEFLSCFDEIDLETWFDAGADLEAVEKAAGLDEEARQARQDAAYQMFLAMDEDNSGWVSPQEVITGMSKLKMPGGAEEVRSLLSMADTDGDGKIEPDEFIAWFEWRYQEQKKRGVVMIPGKNWWEGAPEPPPLPDPAPLDTKDGLGEVKKGNVEISGESTLIPVGGLSRVVTSMAVLQLAEQGKLDLNLDVGRYMDDDIRIDGRGRAWSPASWSKSTEFWERDMSIAQLLANLSGADTKWTGVREENWQMKDLTKEGRELAAERAAEQQELAEAKTEEHREAAARKQQEEIAKKKASGRKKKVKRKKKEAKKYQQDDDDGDIEATSHEVGSSLVDDGLPPIGERLVNYFPKCLYPPGQVHTDPAFGYALLGHIVEQVSGLSLWQYAAYNIFAPLKMQATTLSGPGFLNPGPDPELEAREEAAIQKRQSEKFKKRKEQMEIDKARADAIRKADEAKRWHDKMAAMRGEETKLKGQTIFGEMVEAKKRFEEVAKTEARDRQWVTDLAWEKQMDAERARQRALDRDRAALAVREGRQLDPPQGWKGEWPPQMWHCFRAWPGFRLTAWAQGVPKPATNAKGPQLVLNHSPRSPIPALAPALSLLSTGRDMGRLLICLCNGGSYKGQRILEAATVRASQAQYYAPHPALGGATLSGFAEYRDMVNNALVIDSGDPATGTSSSILLLTEHKVGLFISFNCCSGYGMHRIQPSFTQRFLDHFYPVPPAPEGEDGEDDTTPPPPPPPPTGGAATAALEDPTMLDGGGGVGEGDGFDDDDEGEQGSEPESEDDGTEEQRYRREFRARRKHKAAQAQLGREVTALFQEHTLDLFSAFAPLDPDGDYRISRSALGKGLRRLIPTIQTKHIEYLGDLFPAPDKSPSDDEDENENEGTTAAAGGAEDDDVTLREGIKMAAVAGEEGVDPTDDHGTGDASDEDEGEGAVDYRALSNAFGQSWVASMAPRLQSAEHLAEYAAYRSRRDFSARPYVGHYASTRSPANTIDLLGFYFTVIVVEPSENAHLTLRRFHPAVRAHIQHSTQQSTQQSTAKHALYWHAVLACDMLSLRSALNALLCMLCSVCCVVCCGVGSGVPRDAFLHERYGGCGRPP